MGKVVSMGLQELQSIAVKELASTMPWLQGRELLCCETIDQLKDYIDKAISANLCTLDLETTGLSTRLKNGVPVNKIVGFCLSYNVNSGMYVPINHKVDPELNLDQNAVFEQIQRLIANCVTIYHHAKFDLQFLKNYGFIIPPPEMMHDTLILARLYDAGEKNIKLKYLSAKLLNQEMIEFAEVAGKSKRFDLISPREGYIYGASDGICTLQLFLFFMEQDTIKMQMGLYTNIERKTIYPVMTMETNYIKIDVPYLEGLRDKTIQRMADLKKEVFAKIGHEFNIDSPNQLGKVLFDEMKWPGGVKTKNGQWQTDDEVLKKLAKTYPVAKNISEYRELTKSLGTYVENILKNRDENDCVKLSFSQTGTDTGRFSSPGGQGIEEDGYCGFNVQSLPAKKDELMDLRRAFIAREGYTIVAMDFSGEELRVAANLSEEPKWVTAFLNNEDLHQQTADAVGLERKAAKCVSRGTLIASERGWIPIENLKPGDRVVTHTGELKPVTDVFDMGTKPGIRVTTEGGHCIECGENHRFLTENGTWVRAEDLRPCDVIRIVSCVNMTGTKQRVHFNIWSKGDECSPSEDSPYIEITKNWAKLLGYVMGDGSAHLNRVLVVCSDIYRDVKDDIVSTAIKLGLPVKSKLRESRGTTKSGKPLSPMWAISVGSRIVVRFLSSIGVSKRCEWRTCPTKDRSKSTKVFRVPRVVFESPKDVIAGYLQGLFETDGTVGKCDMSMCTKDIELARDVQLLLLQFGIKASISSSPSKWFGKMYHKVYFGRAGAEIFEKEIGFISASKKARLSYVSNKNHRGDSAYTFKWSSAVKTVEKIPELALMDLTVEDDHTYVAQGLVTHNTINFGILYGMGPQSLGAGIGISQTEAKMKIAQFFQNVNILKRWIDREVAKARKLKYARTALGRIRPLGAYYDSGEDGQRAHADRCAVNHAIQGMSADIMKATMVRIHNWIFDNGYQDDVKMLITVHDELVFEIKTEKMDFYVPKLNNIMLMKDILQGMLNWKVPLAVDAEYGPSWHVEGNYFKEHPEGLNEPDVVFTRPGQVGGRFAIALGKTAEYVTGSKDTVADQVTQVTNQVIQESSAPVGMNLSIEKPVVDDGSLKEENGALVYVIRDRSFMTSTRYNLLMSFLSNEQRAGILYKSPKQQLIIRDKDGNSLLVSDITVNYDTFKILARFLGI